MDQDEVLTHSSSKICTSTSNETRNPNTIGMYSETPSNVHSQKWSHTSRDSSVLYQETSTCLKFLHIQNFEYACIFIFVLHLVH